LEQIGRAAGWLAGYLLIPSLNSTGWPPAMVN